MLLGPFSFPEVIVMRSKSILKVISYLILKSESLCLKEDQVLYMFIVTFLPHCFFPTLKGKCSI